MERSELPDVILWEMTYACPLRCTHCYTDGGRRAARQLPREEMLRMTEILAGLRPRQVHIGGGEPLIVPDVIEVFQRLSAAGLPPVLSTSGFGLTAELAHELARVCHSIHVSIDGPDAQVNDPIRGRAGSFDAAIGALGHFDRLARERRQAGGGPLRFGIDCTLVRNNFDHMSRMLTEVASRFAELEFVLFNCAIPNGHASRESYQRELLTDEQLALLNDDQFADSLRALAPGRVVVALTDNTDLQMRPHRVREGTAALDFMVIEPDGQVRALPIYEGLVGSVLEEPPEVLWQRVITRRDHPFVVEQLAGASTMAEWAAATRRINEFFASPTELLRIRGRKPYGAED